MITLRLGPADLGRVRFVDRPHPVGTAVLASQVLRGSTPGPSPAAGASAMAAPLLAAGPLRHLLPERGLVPDFLTPYQGLDSVEAGLDAIRSTPRRRVRADVAKAYAHLPATPWRRRLAEGDRDAVELLASALGEWFEAVLRPHWTDLALAQRRWVDRAAQAWALSGVDGVLGGLHPAVRWRPPVLEVDTWWSADLRGTGQGLLLAPSLYAGPRPRLLVERDKPVLLVYPVPHWSAGPPAARPGGNALAQLPGRTDGDSLRRTDRSSLAGRADGDSLERMDRSSLARLAGRADGDSLGRLPERAGGDPLAHLAGRSDGDSLGRPPGHMGGDALARLVGRTRAAVLRRLGEPGRHTTTALARAAGISLPSASEHAAALRAAGLITSERDGGAVVHRLTPLGAALLGGG